MGAGGGKGGVFSGQGRKPGRSLYLLANIGQCREESSRQENVLTRRLEP